MKRPTPQTLYKRIAEGISLLANTQSQNGSFMSFASSQLDMSKPTERHTSFITSLILSCIKVPSAYAGEKELAKLNKITEKGIDFLLKERHREQWSWNYWLRSSKESLSIPDDLDDTFCALSAIHLHRPELIDGAALASIVKLLVHTEQQPGGPYNTWLLNPYTHPAWKDIDIGVNANVGYFLSLQDIAVPGINKLIEQAINTENYSSRYYFSPITICYFIARTHPRLISDAAATKLIRKILKVTNWQSPLETALAISSLIRLGFDEKKLTEQVAGLIQAEWHSEPFYKETVPNGIPSYAGCVPLTTAFCIEALRLYSDAINAPKKVLDSQKTFLNNSAIEREHAVLVQCHARFSLFPENKKLLPAVLEKVANKDPGKQITLLPHFFHQSLAQKKDKLRISKKLIDRLGYANLCGWIAYRIYDDFLDDEGKPELLSLGNMCLRELTLTYSELLPPSRSDIFIRLMDQMDEANTWERNNSYRARIADHLSTLESSPLPDYGDYSALSYKSLPHCLGPVSILLELGYRPKSKEVESIISFFHHYLIARQLNDDAHDWIKDLKKGFVNSSGAKVLNAWRKSIRPQNEQLSNAFNKMQRIFWETVVMEVIEDIQMNITYASSYIQSQKKLINPRYFESLLQPLRDSIKETLIEREKMKTFLDEYQKS